MEHDPARPRPHASPVNGWVHSWCGPRCPCHGKGLRSESFRKASYHGIIGRRNRALRVQESELYNSLVAHLRFRLREDERMRTLRIIG